LALVPLIGVVTGFLVVGGGVASPETRYLVTGAVAGPATPCQLQMADRPLSVALCETFDQPASRSADLNDTPWGVSRQLAPEPSRCNRSAASRHRRDRGT
jgi:hypothetical protein